VTVLPAVNCYAGQSCRLRAIVTRSVDKERLSERCVGAMRLCCTQCLWGRPDSFLDWHLARFTGCTFLMSTIGHYHFFLGVIHIHGLIDWFVHSFLHLLSTLATLIWVSLLCCAAGHPPHKPKRRLK
jgi:hypothetical protein